MRNNLDKQLNIKMNVRDYGDIKRAYNNYVKMQKLSFLNPLSFNEWCATILMNTARGMWLNNYLPISKASCEVVRKEEATESELALDFLPPDCGIPCVG